MIEPMRKVHTNQLQYINKHHMMGCKTQIPIARLAGCPICFKRLMCGGNLLVMNVDLEDAQVGVADSFLSTNEPEYSGILTEDPVVLAEYFTKACHTHIKR
jgi:hypothetical protein